MKQIQKKSGLAVMLFAAAITFLSVLPGISQASICRILVNDVEFKPPQKPVLTVGSTVAMRIFGENTHLCTSVASSGSGITITKTLVNQATTACTTEVRVSVTVTSAAALGERTFTVFFSTPALPGTIMPLGTFKVDIANKFCNTAEGQLSLMMAPIALNPVVTPSPDNTTYKIGYTSNLFKVAQSEVTNMGCQNSVTFRIYLAASSPELSNLDQLAANDNAEEFVSPAGLKYRDVTFTRSGNTLSCSVSLPRSMLPAGTRFYRIGKRISKEGDFDPYVFSPVFSFNVVNNPPIANAGSDKSVTSGSTTLSAAGSSDDDGIRRYSWSKAVGPGTPVFSNSTAISTSVSGLLTGTYTFRVRVEDTDGAAAFDEVNVVVNPAPVAAAQPDLVVEGISQRFFGGGNGTVGDGTFTYYMLPQTFCTGLPPLTSFTQAGTLPSSSFASVADKRIMKLDYNLPDMKIYIKNNGAASTGAGFHVELFKTTSSVALKSFTSPSLAAGASAFVTYSGRGVAPVYRFPGFDTDDPRFCYVRQEINGSYPPSYELENNPMQIKIDSRTVITESNENNNSLSVNSSTNPIVR